MKLRCVSRILWGLCCLLLTVVYAGDYIYFTKHPELYPIGCEGLGWSYASSGNYALASLITVVWSFAGVVISVCYRCRYSGKILLTHFALTVILILSYRFFMVI